VLKVIQDHKEAQVIQVLKDILELKGLKEVQVIQVLKVIQALKDI
jgi:hypothetical protein